MIQMNRSELEKIINVADRVYSHEKTLFVITKKKTYIARELRKEDIEYAIECYHEKLSRDLKILLNRSDECDKFVRKHYSTSSIQHISNMLGVSIHKVQSTVDRLLATGQICKKKRKNTKWGAFIKENYKTMTKQDLIKITGMTKAGIARAIKRIQIDEEEQSEFR